MSVGRLHQETLHGNALRLYRSFRRDPIDFLVSTRDIGDIVRIPNVTGATSYIIHHPALIRAVMATQEERVIKGNAAKVLGLTVGEGLLTSEAAKHRHQRAQLSPAFRADMVDQVSDDILRLTDERIASWANTPHLPVTKELLDLTLDIVCEGLFGIEVGEERDLLHESIERAVTFSAQRLMQSMPMPYWLPTRANRLHKEAVHELNGIVERLLSRSKTSRQSTVLHHILAMTDLHGDSVSQREVRDHIVTFLIAGHETSANLLNWMLFVLAKHQGVREALYLEVDASYGTSRPSTDDIRDLPYLRQVIRETLRLYPPAWTIMRQSVHPVFTEGVHIGANATLIVVPYALHRDERWFPDPDAFRPERFHPQTEPTWPRFAYIPFGTGSRTCIGNRLANAEIALVMCRILQKYRWTIETESGVPEPSVSLRVKGGLKASFVPR